MKSTSTTVLVFFFALISLTAKSLASVHVVQCVIQAFGTGLEDKGITVEVRDNGFFCATSIDSNPIMNSARFVNGEAEVPLSLKADSFKLCMSSISVWVNLPYKCDRLNRLITEARWGNNFPNLGSCRALQQKCEGKVSTAAVPYFDMWCRRPPIDGGRPEEMELRWAFSEKGDNC